MRYLSQSMSPRTIVCFKNRPIISKVDTLLSPSELAHRFESQIDMRIETIAASIPRSVQDDTRKFLTQVQYSKASTIKQAPGAAQRALATTQNLDSSLMQLVRIVEEDPTLSQGLLRFANSAYYAAGGGTVVSLTQAAQRIGVSGVQNVVLSTMVSGMVCRPGTEYQQMVDQVYAHMIRTAPIARAIARTFQTSPDEAFALGLLHDVGKLVIFDVIGTLRNQVRRDVSLNRTIVLQALNAVHEAVGGLAVLRWDLGPSVAHAIATHHRTPAPAELDRTSELLFIAERADHAFQGRYAMAPSAWWEEGSLTGSPELTESALDKYAAEREA